MKKLQIETESGWKWVFCHNLGRVAMTEIKSKALPQMAIWADDDLDYFRRHFGSRKFRLHDGR